MSQPATKQRAAIATLEAIVSAFCKATGEPIPQDAICAARRHREALEEIWSREGGVCDTYEICEHRACKSSYTAWVVAATALGRSGFSPASGDSGQA